MGKPGLQGMLIWIAPIVLIWLLNFTAVPGFNPYLFSIVMYAGINVILSVGLNLVNGFTGQFSIGHAGFMAVGGYVSAYVTTTMATSRPQLMETDPSLTLVFIAALLAGGLVAAAVGWLVGLPSLRLKGDYLAIVTLGFGEIIRVVLLNMEVVGGARGLPGIPSLSSFGWVYTFVVLSVFAVWRLVNSSHGRALLAVREDEIAGDAMGVNTTQAKVRAFTLGAFTAGIAGGLFAHYLSYLNPSIFDFNRSFEVVIMVVLGGMGSVTGSVVAALFLTGLREALRPLQELTGVDYRMVIYSLVLIILMLTRPNGLFGTRELHDFLPEKWRLKLLGKEPRT
jgi:branched-chain amino acid transport system permease protein